MAGLFVRIGPPHRYARRTNRYWSDLDQRHAVNLYLSFRISDRTSVSTKIALGHERASARLLHENGNDFFVSSMRNTLRLPTYSRVDVRANRTFNWARKRLTLFAEVINLFNRDNVRFNPPGVNTATGRCRTFRIDDPDRAVGGDSD